MKTQSPYGAWPSPILASMVAGKSAAISETQVNKGRLFWCQSLADEKGRNAIMMHDNGVTRAILPRPLSAKSKVHEYGGAAYTVADDTLYFVLADDQRIYALDIEPPHGSPQTLVSETNLPTAAAPRALTPEDSTLRFADIQVDRVHNRLIAVCEEHGDAGVDNYLVAVALDGSQKITALAKGADFYASPRISPNGQYVCWLTWNHPDLPWDATELWLADVDDDSATSLTARRIAGNGDESITQPLWSPDNHLYFVSDRSNWWNIFSVANSELHNEDPQARAVLAMDAEFATPQWVFGMANYGFLSADTILASYTSEGRWHLAEINLSQQPAVLTSIESEFSLFQSVSCENNKAVFISASASQDSLVQTYDTGQMSAITSSDNDLEEADISFPESITFPTSDQGIARALFYPPNNKAFCDAEGKPPLIVICHGGPTGATESRLNLKIQFWTSRGFAVADVNYRGSTGYGRQYRHSLLNKWGIYDVDDVCAVVDFLVQENRVDPQRTIIKGGSAGGYTVLAALAFRTTFKVGVSLYGIGDLEMLAKDTHKFEARYLDKLVAPYPEGASIYRQRSPIHAVDNISCPLLIFQGLEDKVVPPNQSQTMFDAVKAKGEAVAYVTYANEAHGFRDPDNIHHMLNAELYFYSQVFGIALPKGSTLTIPIANLDN